MAPSTLTKPTPQTLTILFKYHTTTVFLHVSPTQTFSSIKTALLEALSETCPTQTLHDQPLPSSAEDILFAKSVLLEDESTQTWQSMEPDTEAQEVDDLLDEDVKGKSKGRPRKSNGTAEGYKQTPAGQDLKDGATVAFKFRDQSSVDGAAGPEESERMRKEREEWDVVLPVYDSDVEDEGYEEEDGVAMSTEVA